MVPQVIELDKGKCYLSNIPKSLDGLATKGLAVMCGPGCTYNGRRLATYEILHNTFLYLVDGTGDVICGHRLSSFIREPKSGQAPGAYGQLILPTGFNPDKSYIEVCCNTWTETGEPDTPLDPTGQHIELMWYLCDPTQLCTPGNL